MFKIKAPDGSNNITGKIIADIRKNKGLSQRKLALRMQLLGYDVDNHFVRRVETGERFVTDIDLKIFCDALEVPITDLIKTENEPPY